MPSSLDTASCSSIFGCASHAARSGRAGFSSGVAKLIQRSAPGWKMDLAHVHAMTGIVVAILAKATSVQEAA